MLFRSRRRFDGTSFEPTSFVGTTPSYLTAHSYKLAEGSSFTSEDVTKHRRVAVIGQEVVKELFGGASAVGQTMKVNGSNYEVIGVLAKKGTNGTTNEDSVVMAPITTVQDSLTGVGPIDSITVQATITTGTVMSAVSTISGMEMPSTPSA